MPKPGHGWVCGEVERKLLAGRGTEGALLGTQLAPLAAGQLVALVQPAVTALVDPLDRVLGAVMAAEFAALVADHAAVLRDRRRGHRGSGGGRYLSEQGNQPLLQPGLPQLMSTRSS